VLKIRSKFDFVGNQIKLRILGISLKQLWCRLSELKADTFNGMKEHYNFFVG